MPGTLPAVSIGSATVIASPSGTTDGELPRQPVGRVSPAGDRERRHGRRQRHRRPRLRRHPADTPDLRPGQVTQTVTVTVNPEPASPAPAGAPPETFTVNLSNPAGATIASAVGVGAILVPGAMPAVSIGPATVVARTGGPTEASFLVTLSAPSDQTVTVDYATADGTAMAGTDYVATAGTVVFAPGQTEQTITVMVSAAPRYDVSKTFTVNLSDPSGVSIDGGSGHRHDREPQCAAAGRDHRDDGDDQSRRADRRDLHRHAVGPLEPAGDRRLPDGRRQCPGGLRLRRRSADSADLRGRPDRANGHAHGQRRAGRRGPEVLHDRPLRTP